MSIPCFQDLLAHNLIDDDPAKCSQAAENCLLPITSGIEAIGSLIATHDEDSGLPDDTIRDLGWLLAFLAKMSGDLQHMKDDANYTLRKRLNCPPQGGAAMIAGEKEIAV